MKLFFLILLITACSTNRTPASIPYFSWDEYLVKEIISTSLPQYFPDSNFLGKWAKSTAVVVDPKSPKLSDVQELSLKCSKDSFLYPAHPQQYTKEYLHGIYANYLHHKLPVTSAACTMPNPNRRFCLRSTYANLYIMSDLYEDACGNYYRGYWLTAFLKSDESMGTLFSKGRTAYEKPNSQFPGEYVMGDTYKVSVNDFLFLGSLLQGDLIKIQNARRESTKLGFKRQGLLFTK